MDKTFCPYTSAISTSNYMVCRDITDQLREENLNSLVKARAITELFKFSEGNDP